MSLSEEEKQLFCNDSSDLVRLWSTKLFCLLDQVPVNWLLDSCMSLTLLFHPFFFPLSFKFWKTLPHFHCSLTAFCMSASAYSDMQWRKWNTNRADEWLDQLTVTSVILAPWTVPDSYGLRTVTELACSALCKSATVWRMLKVFRCCLVISWGCSLCSSVSHLPAGRRVKETLHR